MRDNPKKISMLVYNTTYHVDDEMIGNFLIPMPETKSCEQMALKLKDALRMQYTRPFTVRIFEDNENGCEV